MSKPMPIEPYYRRNPRIKIHQYESYLPNAFDDEMTLLQKVNKIIQSLYDYAKITEEMLEKWNEVYDWVMGEGLEQSVNNQLQIWLDDGTFEEIINEKLLAEINENVKKAIEKVDNAMDALDRAIDNMNQEIKKATDFMYQEYYNMGLTTFEWSE